MSLTVAMATYGDPRGVWLTLDSLRKTAPAEVKALVLDNAPKPCRHTRDAALGHRAAYVHDPTLTGTSTSRSALFALAEAEFGLGTKDWIGVADCHVTFLPGAVEYLLGYSHGAGASLDLISGPLRSAGGQLSTHWQLPDDTSRPKVDGRHPPLPGALWGKWAYAAALQRLGEPFEVPNQGLGFFAMRGAAWPGLHPHHQGWGGVQGYLHEKVRRGGGRCLCLPRLQWSHCFIPAGANNVGTPYPRPNGDYDVLRNLMLHYADLGYDPKFPMLHHPATCRSCQGKMAALMTEVDKIHPGCFASKLLPDLRQPEEPAAVAPAAVRTQAPPRAVPAAAVVQAPQPPTRVRLLGVWYSNNAAPAVTMAASLESVRKAVNTSRYHVEVVTCPWEPVEGNPFREVLYGRRERGSHEHIVRQQQRAVAAAARPHDAVCFLEHDVLYPEDYFDRVGDALAASPAAPVVSNLDCEGVGPRGYQRVKTWFGPLHQLTLPTATCAENWRRALADCAKQGWAYLEPQGSREGWLMLPRRGERPSIHVGHGKRFTTHHEVCYEPEPWTQTHPYWGPHAQYLPAAPGATA